MLGQDRETKSCDLPAELSDLSRYLSLCLLYFTLEIFRWDTIDSLVSSLKELFGIAREAKTASNRHIVILSASWAVWAETGTNVSQSRIMTLISPWVKASVSSSGSVSHLSSTSRQTTDNYAWGRQLLTRYSIQTSITSTNCTPEGEGPLQPYHTSRVTLLCSSRKPLNRGIPSVTIGLNVCSQDPTTSLQGVRGKLRETSTATLNIAHPSPSLACLAKIGFFCVS